MKPKSSFFVKFLENLKEVILCTNIRKFNKMNRIKSVVGVYNSDGGIIGELTYVAKKIMGKTKCDLCSLTHSTVSEKK